MAAADLVAPFHGVRIEARIELDLLERCRAYASVMPDDQCFSHQTAARLWNCPLPRSASGGQILHVSSRGGAGRARRQGVVGHELSGEHVRVTERLGLRVTDPVTTWLQLAGVLGPRWLVAAGDHFVLDPIVADRSDARPYVTLDELGRRVQLFSGRHCRRARDAVERVRSGVESPRETFLRLELIDSGLAEPLTNVPICDASGRQIAIGDLVYPAERVLVEYDGEQHRTDSKQYRRDIDRHDDLLAAGWTHIRISKESPPAAAVQRTRAALRDRSRMAATPSIRHERPPSAANEGRS